MKLVKSVVASLAFIALSATATTKVDTSELLNDTKIAVNLELGQAINASIANAVEIEQTNVAFELAQTVAFDVEVVAVNKKEQSAE